MFATSALAMLVAGCSPEVPDYQSVWATETAATTTSAASAADPPTLADYLAKIGVSGTQVSPDELSDLTVSIPTPPGWADGDTKSLPPETVAITKGLEGDPYPLAMLVVFALDGDFDAADVIEHSFAEAEASDKFHKLGSSTADFHGFPSAMLQGSYYERNLQAMLQSYMRVVIATGSAPTNRRYLVQLTVASLTGQADAEAADIEAVIGGFTVAAR